MFADNISLAPALKPCPAAAVTPRSARPSGFAHGTRLRTVFGMRRVEDLKTGDLLLDTDSRVLELRTIRQITPAAGHLIQIDPSAFGLGLQPARLHDTLLVGAGQALGMRDWRTDILYGAAALVPAYRLVDDIHIHRSRATAPLLQLGFDRDGVVCANGLLAQVTRSRAQISQDSWQEFGEIFCDQSRAEGARRFDM